jgi:hypothetical protein
LLLAIICFAAACRAPVAPQPQEERLSGEPETYTATIVRSLEDGERREVTETRVCRSGDMRREEWLEQGERRALILRYDTGKRFLLNLDKQLYVESDLTEIVTGKPKAGAPNQEAGSTVPAGENERPNSDTNRQASALDFVEDNFSEEPVKIETRALADESVADHRCKVVERRLSFADGRSETIKQFRAEDLSGLIIKTEMESLSGQARVKVVTEWRDLKLEVSTELFAVPASFKKVQSLSTSR